MRIETQPWKMILYSEEKIEGKKRYFLQVFHHSLHATTIPLSKDVAMEFFAGMSAKRFKE